LDAVAAAERAEHLADKALARAKEASEARQAAESGIEYAAAMLRDLANGFVRKYARDAVQRAETALDDARRAFACEELEWYVEARAHAEQSVSALRDAPGAAHRASAESLKRLGGRFQGVGCLAAVVMVLAIPFAIFLPKSDWPGGVLLIAGGTGVVLVLLGRALEWWGES
jgi:hypothetical protein